MKKLLFLCCAFLILDSSQLFAQFGLGKLKKAFDAVVKVSEMNISEEDEIALGGAISENIRNRFGVQQDPEVTRYVSLVGLVVAEKSERPDLPYRFIVLDTDTVNAFAAPGGFIHITRGALAAMSDEAELAGVLGHEIAHVTLKHTLGEIKKMKGIELAEGQTALSGNPEILQQVADKMTEAVLKGFGREEELESDQVGVVLASKPAYDPQGLPRFLETLRSMNSGSDKKAGLFSSHPETSERLERLQKQIAEDNLGEGTKAVLSERYKSFVKYEPVSGAVEEVGEGVRGLAGGSEEKPEEEGKQSADQEEQPEPEKKKKSRFSLARLANPLGSGEKKQTAEVTSAGAAKGVGEEAKEGKPAGPKNPALVEVKVTAEDLTKFKNEGELRQS